MVGPLLVCDISFANFRRFFVYFRIMNTVYTSSSQSDWRTVERSIRILLKTKHDKKQLFVSEKLRMKDFSSIDFKDNVRFVVRRYLKTIGIKVPKLKGQKIQVSDAVLLIRCKDYTVYALWTNVDLKSYDLIWYIASFSTLYLTVLVYIRLQSKNYGQFALKSMRLHACMMNSNEQWNWLHHPTSTYCFPMAMALFLPLAKFIPVINNIFHKCSFQ